MTTRNAPRISINKLGEYLTANPIRRRSIIKAQKNPPDAIVARYKKGYPILEEYFITRNADVLFDGAEALRSEVASSDWVAGDNSNTADAIESFIDIAHQLPLGECEIFSSDGHEFVPLVMSGVAISVRPEFFVKQIRNGRSYIGALKFHWIRDVSSALGEGGGTYVSTALYQYLLEHNPTDNQPDHRLCFSIDLFRKEAWEAPATYRRLKTHLEAACEEIALRWDSV